MQPKIGQFSHFGEVVGIEDGHVLCRDYADGVAHTYRVPIDEWIAYEDFVS